MTRLAENSTDKIAGGLLGLLIGDAVGVPYEFHKPVELAALDDLDMVPPDQFKRAHFGVPPGTWSDDGAQVLCRKSHCRTWVVNSGIGSCTVVVYRLQSRL